VIFVANKGGDIFFVARFLESEKFKLRLTIILLWSWKFKLRLTIILLWSWML
jgi:hypothetical protein